MGHTWSGGSASVAPPIPAHPGVRLSKRKNECFVCMVRAPSREERRGGMGSFIPLGLSSVSFMCWRLVPRPLCKEWVAPSLDLSKVFLCLILHRATMGRRAFCSCVATNFGPPWSHQVRTPRSKKGGILRSHYAYPQAFTLAWSISCSRGIIITLFFCFCVCSSGVSAFLWVLL